MLPNQRLPILFFSLRFHEAELAYTVQLDPQSPHDFTVLKASEMGMSNWRPVMWILRVHFFPVKIPEFGGWCIDLGNTLQGTNISHPKGSSEDDCPFAKVGYVSSLGGIGIIILLDSIGISFRLSRPLLPAGLSFNLTSWDLQKSVKIRGYTTKFKWWFLKFQLYYNTL